MIGLRFTFYGDEQLNRTLVRFSEHAHDARPAWRAIRRDFIALEKAQFRSQGQAGSGGWRPLSPDYAAWKARHYPGKTILRRTDELFRSLTVGPAVNVVERQFMIIGSDVDYGAYHQAGGPNLPQRRPIELPEFTRTRWVKILQRYLVTGEVLGT